MKWWSEYGKPYDISSTKLNMGLPYDAAIPLLGIYPTQLKTVTKTQICTSVLTVALFSMAKWWKQLRSPFMDEYPRRSVTSPKARGGDLERQAVTAQEQCRGASPHPRSRAAAERSFPMSEVRGGAERSNPTSKERLLQAHMRAERSYSTFKVRRDDLSQGKEQRLRFAGAAVKRYPTCKVRETQVRR